ncbi:hypothetical protein [Xenorhabdus sp. BG5]|uniref:hypothetical protein n=1 Tax=Xenorhabdus sp. BG5 TaxID=2782014 RepID=UPI00187DE427|nr:hypothetical protein [Xenorhabdus sp. BG5]MBE8595631.1 hypothetical protein [Xenorhabdus sp. BG5]
MKRISDEFVDGMVVFDDGKLKPFSQQEKYRKKKIADLEKELSENEDLYVLLTFEEAARIVKNACGPNPNSSWKEAGFLCLDVATSFTGNIIDTYGLGRLANELSSNFSVKVTEFVDRYGNRSIKLTGRTGIRKFLTAAKYSVGNWKMIDMGIGTQGMQHAAIDGARKVVFVAAAYRLLELAFRDEYDVYNFFGNITMDAAKTAVGVLAGIGVSALAGMILTTGTYALAVAVGVVLAGVLVASLLYYLDSKFEVSKALIEYMRKKELSVANKLDYRKQPFVYPYPRIK